MSPTFSQNPTKRRERTNPVRIAWWAFNAARWFLTEPRIWGFKQLESPWGLHCRQTVFG